MNTILGKKIEQTQRFLENGDRIPVTLVAVTPNTVLQVKTTTTDGYNAIQIGTGMRKKSTQSQAGIAKKAKLTAAPRYIKEVRFFDDNAQMPELGSAIPAADVLQPGDIIAVTGVSKGKGWAGAVKRYHFRGGPRTHGQSDRERAPGSLGQTTTPGRVYKGKRMAGHMGVETATVQNLFVADVIGDKIYVAGLIPGHVNSFITIVKTGKMSDKKFKAMLRDDRFDIAPVEEAPQESEAAAEETNIEETPKAEIETKEANS